ncbi:natural cytotoxicity triggering receptor 3 ligand 1-like [Dendropsophus ebraccatus]|uniref:natural cytotoxicity triggering receptor 3 ligand 1-like n=1 Tax=Dendropsophus ebraccatus TaxID=150705 RepID=UPI0038312F7A
MALTLYRSLLLPLVVFSGLLSHHCSHGMLEIRKVDSPIETLLGHDTTLPCLFYGYQTPLDLSTVSVRWTLRTSEGKDKQVYWFHGGNHTQTRPESHIPDSGLIGGDGSLYISNIQPSDEGEYTCTVFVTPEKAIRKVTMEVSAKLEIRRVDSPIEVSPGHGTTLPCLFYGYEAPLNLSMVSVRWTLRTSEGDKQVYWFHGGDHTQTRPGSHIPESGLMGGDGSLYISNIKPIDDGEYTCTVIVNPEKAIGKVTMEVSAVPTCTVSDPRLEMTPDQQRVATCYVSGFYPQPVTIHWVKHSKASSSNSELDIETCTKAPVKNPNGTYNVRSIMAVRPRSTEEDGDVYSCVITHRSLRDPLTCDVTLSVEDDERARLNFGKKKSPRHSGSDGEEYGELTTVTDDTSESTTFLWGGGQLFHVACNRAPK